MYREPPEVTRARAERWHAKFMQFLWAHPHVASFIMVCIIVVLFGMFFLAVDDIHRLMQ